MTNDTLKMIRDEGLARARAQKKRTDFDLTDMSSEGIIAAAKDIEGLINKELAGRELDPLKIEPYSGGITVAGLEDTEYNEAFDQYLRRGFARMGPEQRDLLESRWVQHEGRALGVGTGSGGGYTVPEGFVRKIKTARLKFGGLRKAPGIDFIPTATGNDLPYPNADDTGNSGALLAEGSAAGEQDITFGQTVLKAFTWTSKIVRVSNLLLQDEDVNLDSWLAARLGERIGRAQAPYLITGTGTGQPEGIVTNAAVGFTTATGQMTTLIYDDFVEMEASIDDAYLENAVWVISPSAQKQLRLIKDTAERPIMFGAHEGAAGAAMPQSILGRPFVVDASMATVAASNKPVLFGDLSNYAVRDVEGMQVLRLSERYAEYNQTAFLVFSRMDARPVDAGDSSYKVLTMAAS